MAQFYLFSGCFLFFLYAIILFSNPKYTIFGKLFFCISFYVPFFITNWYLIEFSSDVKKYGLTDDLKLPYKHTFIYIIDFIVNIPLIVFFVFIFIILDDEVINMNKTRRANLLFIYIMFMYLLLLFWGKIKEKWSKTNKYYFVKLTSKEKLTSLHIYDLLLAEVALCLSVIFTLILPIFYAPLPFDNVEEDGHIKIYQGKVEKNYISAYITVLGADNKSRKFNCMLFLAGKFNPCLDKESGKPSKLSNKNVIIHYIPNLGYQKINIILAIDSLPPYSIEGKIHPDFSEALSNLQIDLEIYRLQIYLLITYLIVLSISLYRFIHFNRSWP